MTMASNGLALQANIYDRFMCAISTASLTPHDPHFGIVADGQIHRFRVDGDKAGSLNGWYVLHLDGKPFGAFGSWKTGQSISWSAEKPETMTAAERAAQAARMARVIAQRDSLRQEVELEAEKRAQQLWDRSRPATDDHPYLRKKAVHAYGIRQLGENLIIPLRDSTGRLRSLQFITPGGEKRFLTGGRKSGCYYSIGKPSGRLCVAEGYSTAASIYQATGYATAVAFDCGNLRRVAQSLRGKFPRLQLILCGDDDWATPGNPGRRYAEEAARAVGGYLALPLFSRRGA